MTITVFIVALESPAGKLGDNLFFFFFVSSSSQSAMEAFLLRHRGQVSKKRVCSEWPWHYSSPRWDEKTNKRQDQIKKKKGRQACERPYLQKEKKKIAEERRDRKKYVGERVKEHFVFWWRQFSHCGRRTRHSQTPSCPRLRSTRLGYPCMKWCRCVPCPGRSWHALRIPRWLQNCIL